MVQEPSVGIDLGTTNCAVAWINAKGEPEIVPNSFSSSITPSVILLSPDGKVVVGTEAKNMISFEKENITWFFKRDMGTDSYITQQGREFTPVDLSAILLHKLKTDAEAELGLEINRAVITVPAYFENRAREETKRAAEMAGLEVLKIINEPTAAALAYAGRHDGLKESVLVYDLGGGTFDISLVEIGENNIRVIGTDGNHNLGGKDWDDRLVNYVCEEFERLHDIDPMDDAYTFQEILSRIEESKKSLSSRERATIRVACHGITETIVITRGLFEEITSDLLGQTETLINKVMDETGYTYDRIGRVIMVGGSTRMPMCRELIHRLIGREPDYTLNPDECVAMGAAIQADMELHKNRKSATSGLGIMKLQDVTAHSLGLIVLSADNSRYENAIILPKNSPIPAEDAQVKALKTRPGGDNELDVYLLQGESEIPIDNTPLGKYTFGGIPHYDGETRVKIRYSYDHNGIVQIDAIDERSGRQLTGPKIDKNNLDISWTLGKPELTMHIPEIYIMLCIDTSYSMEGYSLKQAKAGAINFMKNLDPESASIGLISFDNHARLRMPFTKSMKNLKNAVDALSTAGSTNMAGALEEAYNYIRDVDGQRVIVLLTDGYPDTVSATLARRDVCKQDKIDIIAIGTDGADTKFLKKLATSETGQIFAPAKDLAVVFGNIARNLDEYTGGLSYR